MIAGAAKAVGGKCPQNNVSIVRRRSDSDRKVMLLNTVYTSRPPIALFHALLLKLYPSFAMSTMNPAKPIRSNRDQLLVNPISAISGDFPQARICSSCLLTAKGLDLA